jgi:prevent-host-death family protein
MKTKTLKYPAHKPQSAVLKEVTVAPGIGEVISVRAAKAHLSALLELVAAGQEITITSDGKPKAKLVKAEPRERGKVFQGMGDYLLKQPIHGGPTADEIIRADRDSRP